jgi:hypothetical protein
MWRQVTLPSWENKAWIRFAIRNLPRLPALWALIGTAALFFL